jgi:hypothetical protein
MASKTTKTQRPTLASDDTTVIAHAPHLDLAAQALVDGWTRAQVISALIGRIQRDERYLAYRKACNRRTSYDGQVQADMCALALAAVWLEEDERR